MNLKEKIRVVDDFPKKGISFKDITTLLQDGKAFSYAINEISEIVRMLNCDVIVAPEARGFIVATPVCAKLKLGFVPVRKPGKLPYETYRFDYELEYGVDSLEIHIDGIKEGDRVVVIDDLLATGGTSKAICRLIEKMGGKVNGLVFLAELDFLNGREILSDYPVHSLVHYKE